MAQPIKNRTAKSLSLDVQRINRLRASLLCDSRLDKARVTRAVAHVDGLIDELRALAEDDLIATGMD